MKVSSKSGGGAGTVLHLHSDRLDYDRLHRQIVVPATNDLSAGSWFFVRDWRGAKQGVYLLAGNGWSDETVVSINDAARRVEDPTLVVGAHDGLDGLDGVATGSAARSVLERILSDAAPGLGRFMLDFDSSGRRQELALRLMVANLPAVSVGVAGQGHAPAGVPVSYLSYRYHADGFFLMCKDPRQVRTEMESRYQRAGAAIQAIVGSALDEVASEAEQSPSHWWFELAERHLPSVIDGFRQGLIRNGSADLKVGWLGDTHDLVDSPMHQIIQESESYQEFLKSNQDFQAVRFIVAVLYLSIHNLGVPLINRYFMCYAISRAIEDLFDVDSAAVATSVASGLVHAGRPS